MPYCSTYTVLPRHRKVTPYSSRKVSSTYSRRALGPLVDALYEAQHVHTWVHTLNVANETTSASWKAGDVWGVGNAGRSVLTGGITRRETRCAIAGAQYRVKMCNDAQLAKARWQRIAHRQHRRLSTASTQAYSPRRERRPPAAPHTRDETTPRHSVTIESKAIHLHKRRKHCLTCAEECRQPRGLLAPCSRGDERSKEQRRQEQVGVRHGGFTWERAVTY